MELEKIRSLIEELTGLMEAKKLDELEIDTNGVKIALRRAGRNPDPPAVVVAPAVAPAPEFRPVPGPEPEEAAEGGEAAHVVYSPMVGTFYRSPSPDAESFVDVGDEVTPDTVLCIIEAMKVMNELKAETEGTISAIRAENREAVEFGQPLFVIRPSSP